MESTHRLYVGQVVDKREGQPNTMAFSQPSYDLVRASNLNNCDKRH